MKKDELRAVVESNRGRLLVTVAERMVKYRDRTAQACIKVQAREHDPARVILLPYDGQPR